MQVLIVSSTTTAAVTPRLYASTDCNDVVGRRSAYRSTALPPKSPSASLSEVDNPSSSAPSPSTDDEVPRLLRARMTDSRCFRLLA